MPRRPRIIRPPGAGRSSFPFALLLLTASVSAVARARDMHRRDTPAGPTLADGVRRLRAAVVGDVRELGAMPVGRAFGGPTRRAEPARATQTVTALGTPPPARNDVVGVPWWSESANWGPDVVRWAERTSPTLVAEAGDTVAVPTPALPAAVPGALRERGVHWQAEGVASLLDGGGRAVLVAPGAAVITAVSPIGVLRTPVAVRPVVRGRVYHLSPDGPGEGAPVSARIVVRRGASVDTTWTDPAGRFRLTLSTDANIPADAPADVRLEPLAPPASGREYTPVMLRAVSAARLHMLGVVLLPARWTIAVGSFAGTTITVRAASARGFWQFTRDHGGLPVGRLYDAPYTVAFAPGFDVADAATFWRAAHALGDAWGRPLFVPSLPSTSGDSVDAAGPDVLVRAVPALQADGLTTLGWDGGGTVGSAAIDFRLLRPGTLQPQVVEHELLHALSFGHARG